MNILIIHNFYNIHGGEESVVDMQCRLFRDRGHNVYTYFRDYKEIREWRGGKYRSLLTSMYNCEAAKAVKKLIEEHRIEVALIHNLYPVISPSVLSVLKNKGIRTIWIAHNFRLICPTALLYNRGEICEKCKGGIREINTIINRCEGTFLGSIAYAARSWWARATGMITKNIDCYIVLSEFQKELFIRHGIDEKKIVVIGNTTTFPALKTDRERNNSVLYAARISKEKGTNIFLDAARILPDTSFILAGDGEILPEWGEVPPNVKIVGKVNREELIELYRNCSVFAITSTFYETFALTSIEASLSLCPVIYQRLGIFINRIKEGETGLFFETKEELAEQITKILNDKELAKKIALQSQAESIEQFSQERYIEQFEKVMKKK